MTFEEFLLKVEETFIKNQERSSANQWRYGQTVMNVLWDICPEKHDEIKNSNFNCFYTNRNVAMVLDKLEKEWR